MRSCAADQFSKSTSELLLEYDLRGALGEEYESTAVARYDGAHRLAHRVERVHLVDAFFGYLLAVRLVVLTEVQHEPQQRTLGLVADLLRQIALVLRRLKYTNRVDSVQLDARKLTCRPTALPRPCTLDSAAAAPRRTPRRASSKPSTSQRKPTATAINQYP